MNVKLPLPISTTACSCINTLRLSVSFEVGRWMVEQLCWRTWSDPPPPYYPVVLPGFIRQVSRHVVNTWHTSVMCLSDRRDMYSCSLVAVTVMNARCSQQTPWHWYLVLCCPWQNDAAGRWWPVSRHMGNKICLDKLPLSLLAGTVDISCVLPHRRRVLWDERTATMETGVLQLQVQSCGTAFQLIYDDKLTLAFNDFNGYYLGAEIAAHCVLKLCLKFSYSLRVSWLLTLQSVINCHS